MTRDPRTDPRYGDVLYIRPVRNPNIRVKVEVAIPPESDQPAACLALGGKWFHYSPETWRELVAGAEVA